MLVPNIEDIKDPYWYAEDNLPGIDFCRELIEPGKNETFPDGTVGIRADDDFWTVAALPWDWRFYSLAEIVAALWPHYKDQAILCPDSGTVEQEIYFLNRQLESEQDTKRYLEKLLDEQEKELRRLKAEKPVVGRKNLKRQYEQNDYFINQYEQLVTAFAHEAIPQKEHAGICSVCNLFVSNRVHGSMFKRRKAKGFDPCDDNFKKILEK